MTYAGLLKNTWRLFRREQKYIKKSHSMGSFTGIPFGEQKKAALQIARQYKDRGQVNGIRISTRPDYISIEILNFLLHQGVAVIELGAVPRRRCTG